MARHALLIGVSDFADTRLARLNAPAEDIEALGTVLRDPARGGFDSVTVSLNEDYMPVRDRLATLFDGRDPDDLLLLYYTGHGILGRGNKLFLATPGSDLDRPQVRGVSASELREQMDQTRAERQVLLLDCCHSGAFAQGAKGAPAPAVTQDTFDAGSIGRYVLAAADALQFAWDGDSLKDGVGERRLSRFTAWVVDGLGRGEAAPDDEQITMDALFRYVARRAKAEGSAATPQRYVDRGTGELVIGRNPAAAGPAWAEIVRRLDDADWSVRADAVEAAGWLLRRDGPVGRAARDALDERLAGERDFGVRNRILALLGGGEERAVEPPPPPPPPPPPEDRAVRHDPVVPHLFDASEMAMLMKLGVPADAWATLPDPVAERVRQYVQGLRHTRWTAWFFAAVFLADCVIFSVVQIETRRNSQDSMTLLITQCRQSARLRAPLSPVVGGRWLSVPVQPPMPLRLDTRRS